MNFNPKLKWNDPYLLMTIATSILASAYSLPAYISALMSFGVCVVFSIGWALIRKGII
jgi:hypothetical protein